MNDSSAGLTFTIRRGLSAFLAAFMLFATLNALSFFFRSERWYGLFGDPSVQYVAIGFPVLLWEDRASHGRNLPDGDALATVGLVGLCASTAVGLIAGYLSWGAGSCGQCGAPADSDTKPPQRSQYSLKTLLLTVTIIAVLLGVLRSQREPWRASLILISLAGPSLVLLVAQLSRRWAPRVNLATTIASAAGLIVLAAVTAQFAPDLLDFTRGVLAVFVCWTPQFSVVTGLLLTTRWARTIYLA
jgi:hypothetical protein